MKGPAALVCIIALVVLSVSGCLGCPAEGAPAKDWLPVASAAMKKNSTDAFLIYVHGFSDDGGAVLPVNGKCHRWLYLYVTPDRKKAYDVYVRDGKLESVTGRPVQPGGIENILFTYGDPRIDTWATDSADAVTVANKKYREMSGKALPDSAAYTLEISIAQSIKGKLAWIITYYGPDKGVIANIYVDPQTGKVVYTWIP